MGTRDVGGTMRFVRIFSAIAFAAPIYAPRLAHAELPTHPAVRGAEAGQVSLDGHTTVWTKLEEPLVPGPHLVRATFTGEANAVEIPMCAGRGRITLDGSPVMSASPAPMVLPLAQAAHDAPREHEVTMLITVSAYERRVACGASIRFGVQETTREGLGLFPYVSPHRGGGRAVVFIPPGHDVKAPSALLVGAHPWNGGIWTYAACTELLHEAAARDVVLLMPSGLGNSLYTADAEDEVMLAIDALRAEISIDPRRVSIWGASMGGAGATTIGLHRPDRFASITSFFGDSKYDLSTYVKSILPNEAAAHRVNAVDVVDNARHVPVWLIHGEEDRVSPIAQSEILAKALEAKGFKVRFDRVPHAGHEGPLVARFAKEMVARAAEARAPEHPSRVTFRSVRPIDTSAYGVRIERKSPSEDAFVDVEMKSDGAHVMRAAGVRAVTLENGALGAAPGARTAIVVDADASGVTAAWR